jgi:hypothetical protein
VLKLKKDDARYWEAYLEKIAARIDQAEYSDALSLLEEFNKFSDKENFELVDRHRITHQGFDALNFFIRCKFEEISNNLVMEPTKKIEILNKVKDLIEKPKQIKAMKDRKQKESEKAAYKYLGAIYAQLALLARDKDFNKKAVQNFLKFLSEGEIDDLKKFAEHENLVKWINECKELDTLEDIFYLLIKNAKMLEEAPLKKILKHLEEEIKRICEDRSALSKIGKISAKMREIENPEEHPFLKDENIRKHEKIFSPKNKRGKLLTSEEIRKRLDINEKNFDKVLFGKREGKGRLSSEWLAEVVILRRWNSFSPGLFRRDAMGSLGGGYLVRINKLALGIKDEEDTIENIIIDPGYNFIQNFCSENFSINEIDTVIVTHSHLDHCADLRPLMDLIFQFNKRFESWSKEEGKRKRITLCLSRGAYTKFSSYIRDWQKQLRDVIVLENLPDHVWKPLYEPFQNLLEIKAIETPHSDFGDVSAIGLKITINYKGKRFCLGFTGDTPYDHKLVGHFRGCDILCAHLGTIKYPEIGYNKDIYNRQGGDKREIPNQEKLEKLRETYHESNHLLSYGTEQLIKDCFAKTWKKYKLVVVGEFGEELKYGLRTDLCDKLTKSQGVTCLPSDIGLYIKIQTDRKKLIGCNFCEEFVNPKDIGTFSYGCEDAIQYICESCASTLSDVQKQALIEYKTKKR